MRYPCHRTVSVDGNGVVGPGEGMLLVRDRIVEALVVVVARVNVPGGERCCWRLRACAGAGSGQGIRKTRREERGGKAAHRHSSGSLDSNWLWRFLRS